MMKIKYWGVRGSIPAPLTTEEIREKFTILINQFEARRRGRISDEIIENFLANQTIGLGGTYGGDTTCIEIQTRNSPLIVIDAGTGIRGLGKEMAGRFFTPPNNLNPMSDKETFNKEMHLFFTHYHWDHMQGLPFFVPAFLQGVDIQFYGKQDARQRMSEVLQGQQQYPNFPIEWEDMACVTGDNQYHELGRMTPSPIQVGGTGTQVSYAELDHPDRVFGYAIEKMGRKFVVATDTEHRDSPDPALLKLTKGADILYYDAQYTPEEYADPGMSKFRWGHSTFEWGIKTALAADVKTVVLGHHDPNRSDFELDELYEKAQRYKDQQLNKFENEGKKLEVIMAYQGLEQKL